MLLQASGCGAQEGKIISIEEGSHSKAGKCRGSGICCFEEGGDAVDV